LFSNLFIFFNTIEKIC
jgi:hypothetical protein